MQAESGWQEWRPIDCAPDDGREVLLWQPGHEIYIGSKHPGRWWTDAAWANGYDYTSPPNCRPTHWMPLPTPPQFPFVLGQTVDLYSDGLIDAEKSGER